MRGALALTYPFKGMNINGDKQPWDTPCIGICSTTTGDLTCRGCGRTVMEIRDWPIMTNDEKIQINRRKTCPHVR